MIDIDYKESLMNVCQLFADKGLNSVVKTNTVQYIQLSSTIHVIVFNRKDHRLGDVRPRLQFNWI